MKRIALAVAGGIILLGGWLTPLEAQSHHVIQRVKDAQWGPAPPMMPHGAQISVLSGDPTKPGAYTVRLKFPAHYAVPAHSHPTDEHVVIVSGALTMGMGDKLVRGAASNTTLGPGGFAMMPAGMNHFAYTANETTLVLYGVGPVDIKYVNPADDPRNAVRSED